METCQNGGAAGRLRKLPFGKKMPTFSFQNPPGKIAFAKPKAVRMGAASFAAGSWAKVLLTVARAVLSDVRYREKALGALADLGGTSEKETLRRPMELEEGLWLEGNRSATGVVGRVRRFLSACGYPLKAVVVECESSPHTATMPQKEHPVPTRTHEGRCSPRKAVHPRKGEKAGAFARRMFSSMLAEGRVPREDFFACLDHKAGTKTLLGLLPGGHPLFSRRPMKDGQNHRSWSEPFPTRFGFPVYINSQWRSQHLDKLETLLAKWGGENESFVAFPSTPVQATLFGPPPTQQMSLFQATKKKEPLDSAGPSEKIGAYAKRELYAALAEERVPEEDFGKLLTLEGTKQLLGYSMKTCPLFSLTPMVRRDGRPGSWSQPAQYKKKQVYINGYWMEQHRANLKRLLKRWRKSPRRGSTRGAGETIGVYLGGATANTVEDVTRFASDICKHWTEGFDFSDGAMRLVESRCGKMTKGAKEALKAGMFHPRGHLWFCPENVAPAEARSAVVAAAKHLVGEWGLVSAGVLAECLDVPGTKLNDSQEREAFATFLVCRAGFSVCKLGRGNYVTLAGGADMEETAETVCSLIREFIEEQGRVVRAEAILEEFKNLDEHSLSDLMAHWEPAAIPERDENGTLFFKLLSEYYLPADFGEALEEGVARAEDESTPLTAAWMAAFLSERYGCDFAEDYALDPAGSLKWAIGAVWRESGGHGPRRWKGEGARARFLEEKEQNGENPSPLDLPSQVEATFSGVFTNEDYWQYTVGNYGLSDRREAKIAQIGYIAPCFVRFDRAHWMSVAAFRAATGWNEKTADMMTNVLRGALGTAAMLPVASLGASVTDSLPELVLHANDDDRVLCWTPELVASVAALLCPGVCVANHGVAPFAVTALLVPKPVATKDVFAYAMGLYCARNPYRRDVREAFAFLQANNIRFRFTPRARAEIEEFLAREAD